MGERKKLFFQPALEIGNLRLHLLQDLFLSKKLQIRERHGTAKRIPRVRVAVKKALILPVLSEKSREDLFCGKRRCQGEIAAGDSFGQTENIRTHPFVVAGKHFSRAAKTRSDFVKDEENAIFAADLTKRLHVAHRLRPHPRRPLHQRLHDERRQRAFL